MGVLRGAPIGQLISKVPPGVSRLMAGVVWRETELGTKSLGKNRIHSSEKQEIGHRLMEGWLVILGCFLSLASTGANWGPREEL